MTDFFERVAALRREGQSFAVATVVARRAPVSAHLGDRAIIFADGRMEGFVGGACSREIVRRQARESLNRRLGRLVSIRPDAVPVPESTPEHVVVPMTCVSEGAIDVYIEPFVRARSLVVVGASEIESEDRSPVSLRSAVELMAAAHSVLPALAEARIERLDVNLRPALPDNEPRTEIAPGLLRINGLFRHGWLLAPALVDDALRGCGLAAVGHGRAEEVTA